MRKTMKRIMGVILALTLALGMSGVVYAGVITSGYCGDPAVNGGKDVTWSYNNGTITISGKGDMADYNSEDNMPEYSALYATTTKIVVENGVTSLGTCALFNQLNVKEVILPESLKKIKDLSISSCIHLTKLTIPKGVSFIGKGAFYFSPYVELFYNGSKKEWDSIYKDDGWNTICNGDKDRAGLVENLPKIDPTLSLDFSNTLDESRIHFVAEPAGVTLSETKANIAPGKTLTLTVTVSPAEADQTVTWSSSNEAVATVKDGVVTAVSAGTATITAKTANGLSATCEVTVGNPALTLATKDLVLKAGAKATTLKATVVDDEIDQKIGIVDPDKILSGVKLDAAGGKLKITPCKTLPKKKKIQAAKITLYTKSGLTAELNVKVQKGKVTTTKITPNKTVKLSLSGIKTKTLFVTATPDYYSTKEQFKVSGYNKKIVKVTIDRITGKLTLTALKKGNTDVRVKAGSKSVKIKVKVGK